MPISNNQIKVIIVGVISVSTMLYVYFRKIKVMRHLRKDELFQDHISDLNTNINHHSEFETKFFNTIAVGRSDVTTSLCSRNSFLKDQVNCKLNDEASEDVNCGRLGLKSLDVVIASLEEATLKIDRYEIENSHFDFQVDSRLLLNELRQLMEDAYQIRNKYKQKLIFSSQSYQGSDESDSSSDESFVSAREYYHDELIIDEYIEASDNQQKFLFKAALLELENGNIYYRSKRTELVRCQNDTEYLAKLHCVRLAFNYLLENEEMTKQLEDIGNDVGSMLLIALGYEAENFQHSYRNMITFLESPKAVTMMREELSDKGVEVISFYDVFFDYIVFGGLESLSSPPSSLVSIINNRWLTESFKKSTLNSSIWTILLAKRKFLKHKSGFKAHFYDIVDVIGAPLAWSFLGPDERANQVAHVFQKSLKELGVLMFSDEVRFTCEEELAHDILSRFVSTKDAFCQVLENIVVQSATLSPL